MPKTIKHFNYSDGLSPKKLILTDLFLVIARNIRIYGPITEIKVYEHEGELLAEGGKGFNSSNVQGRITYGE
jgi:hypothetical protein